MAELLQEQEELASRLRDAEVSAVARKCKDVLDRFGVAVLGSHAVIARSLAVVQDLLESDTRTYTSYQRQVFLGARVPEENEFDQIRTQFEAALFPNFHHDILFACLSLDGRGLTSYGAYALVLKDEMITHRATVFEENPYIFSQKHGLRMGERLPVGYRTTWARRDALAKAKLHSEIGPTTDDEDFPNILLKDRNGPGDCDYIEVHIFGRLNRYSIKRVVGKRPRTSEDQLIWTKLERLLDEIGATMEPA